MNSSYLSKDNLIFKTIDTSEKVYIREQSGIYQRIRRLMSIFLVAIFVVTPFIRYQGQQAVYFDLQQQKLQLFSFTLFPQDLVIFSLIFILAAFLLFYVTKFYGRIWCGFTCPQTVWLLMFNWVERRVEGTHNQSKALDKQKLSIPKVAKKTLKHTIWLALSLITSLVFISYFVPVDELYLPFFTLEASGLATSWVLFFAGCTYINAAWIKEKMCQHMCPYSRFQSAMFDSSTKLVTYDATRGENRGKRKIGSTNVEGKGDCVDCSLCVQVCPVGIDIREGLQYECINCALCADACDQTMDKFGYQQGLIKFDSEVKTNSTWKRHITYGGVLTFTLAGIILWAVNWQSMEVNIIRDRQALYRINYNGDIENTYLFKIRNKSSVAKQYNVSVNGMPNVKLLSNQSINVNAGELVTSSITLVSADKQLEDRANVTFNVKADDGELVSKNTSFYGGNEGW